MEMTSEEARLLAEAITALARQTGSLQRSVDNLHKRIFPKGVPADNIRGTPKVNPFADIAELLAALRKQRIGITYTQDLLQEVANKVGKIESNEAPRWEWDELKRDPPDA